MPSPADRTRREARGGAPITRRLLLSGTAAAAAAGLVARPAIARAAASLPSAPAAVSGAASASAATAHQVTFDKYSLMVDGTRLFV